MTLRKYMQRAGNMWTFADFMAILRHNTLIVVDMTWFLLMHFICSHTGYFFTGLDWERLVTQEFDTQTFESLNWQIDQLVFSNPVCSQQISRSLPLWNASFSTVYLLGRLNMLVVFYFHLYFNVSIFDTKIMLTVSF